MTKKERKDWMQELGDTLAKLLESGIVPWECPWVGGGVPTSVATSKAYDGGNAILLNAIAILNGYTSNLWLTYNRAKQLGGNVRKGERGTPVVWANWKPKIDSETGEPIEGQGYYATGGSWVFNLDQTEGIDLAQLPNIEPDTPPQSVTEVWFHMPDRPRVQISSNEAYYNSVNDLVNLPAPALFKIEGAFYEALWHETGHWWTFAHMPEQVGHRREPEKYCFGELVAEMTACLMMQATDIPHTLETSADYIKGWIEPIKSDPKVFTRAFSAATKAAQWMLNKPAAEIAETGESEQVSA